jgi:hypothetical protein
MVSTVEQLMISKISAPQSEGQLSLLTLPANFSWLKHLSAAEIAQFLAELLNCLPMPKADNQPDWVIMADIIDSWRETASLKADPLTAQSIAQGYAELEQGQTVSWATLREELAL